MLADRPAKPLDLWLGGRAPSGLRRVGRLADGWLGSFLTPEQARVAVETIKEAAADAGRQVDEDHYGISLAVAPKGISSGMATVAAQQAPGVDPASLMAGNWSEARQLLERYVDAGLSKFVLRPSGPVTLDEFLDPFLSEAAFFAD
jgi:probable F420-dependent oxidoreductase